MSPHTSDSYVTEHADCFVSELAELCAFPTISAHDRAQLETAEWICSKLEDIGFETELLPVPESAPMIHAECGSGERSLLYYNHYDVQPIDPIELWNSEPFTLTERDGMLFARGVSDDKGDLLARIHALRAWRETVGDLPMRIIFLIEGQEEIGSPGFTELVESYGDRFRADACCWEGSGSGEEEIPEVYCGAKGMLYVELSVHTLDHDLHSSLGGMVPNAAGRLIEAIRCLRDSEGRVTVDGMREAVRPLEPLAAEAVSRLPFDRKKVMESWGTGRIIGDLDSTDALMELMNGLTANIAGFWSGYTGEGAKTVTPAEARAKMDFRLVPDLTADIAEELIRAHLDRHGFSDVEMVRHAAQDPGRTPLDSPVVRVAADAWRDVEGADPLVYPNMTGTGPISFVTNRLRIPTVMTGGVGWYGSRIHSPNECIRKDDYFGAVRYWLRFIERYARV